MAAAAKVAMEIKEEMAMKKVLKAPKQGHKKEGQVQIIHDEEQKFLNIKDLEKEHDICCNSLNK